jgi:plastocyanin
MLVGFVFARRKMFEPYHKFTMTAITLVNWVLIFLLMLVTYRRDVLPEVPQNLGLPGVLIPTLHLIPGAIAQIIATYLVIRMWFENQLPEWFKVKNIKIYMRTTLVLWLLTALLGVLTWAVINKGLFSSAPATSGAVATQEAGTTVVRLIAGNKFDPAELTVAAGTTVQFVNADTKAHTVTADDGSFDSGEMKAGATFSQTFTQAGDVAYYCDFHGGKGHEGMSAVIHVTGGSGAAPVATKPATAAPTTAPTKPATAAATAAANQGATSVVVVNMLDDEFEKKEITVPVGATVRWENKGKHKHTATADDGSFDSGQLTAGGSFEQSFPKAGDVPLYCANHGDKGGKDMAMIVHVVSAASVSVPTVAATAPATAAATVNATVVAAAAPLIKNADDTPNKVPYVIGAQAQTEIIKAQNKIITDALKLGHIEDAQAAAEAILNVIEGGKGKDRDLDNVVNQPGDGYGLQKYIFSINEAADTVQSSASGSAKSAAVDMGAMGQDALKQLQTISKQAQSLIDAKTLVDARKVDLSAVSKLDDDIAMIVGDVSALKG